MVAGCLGAHGIYERGTCDGFKSVEHHRKLDILREYGMSFNLYYSLTRYSWYENKVSQPIIGALTCSVVGLTPITIILRT